MSSAQTDTVLPQVDLLWHYDCVVRLRPRPLNPPSSPAHLPGRSTVAAAVLPLSAASSHHRPLHPADDEEDAKEKSHLQRRVLQRVFSIFDQNRDGRVSTQEITQIFHILGITPQTDDSDSIHSLLERLVTDSDGHVDEQEFCVLYDSVCCTTTTNSAGSSSAIHADVDQDLLAAFHVFDKDNNGLISPRELQSVLCSLGFPQARQLDACVDMIARVDRNGDGQVDFLEFKKLFDLESASLFLVSS